MPALLLLLSLTTEPTPLKLPNLERAEDHAPYKAWLRSCKGRKPVAIEFVRIECDHVFKTEKRWKGRFVWKNEFEWTYSSKPLDFPEGTKGGLYPLAVGEPEEIVSTKVFVEVNGQRFTRGGNNPLMPRDPSLFLGRPSAKTLIAENVWAFLKKETESTAHFVVYPKQLPGSPEWRVLQVMWDKKQTRPRAVKVTPPGENTDTVYVLESWKTLDGD